MRATSKNGGKIGRFRQAQREPCGSEAKQRPDGCVHHCREAPDEDGDGISPADAEFVQESSAHEQSRGVGELKSGDDVAIVRLCPAEIFFYIRLQQADHLPVDIVYCCREEQQGQYDPADRSHSFFAVNHHRRCVFGATHSVHPG